MSRENELAQKIRKHREKYYNGEPEISDDKFDALEDELRQMNPDHPALSETGAEPESSGWEKSPHSMPMFSLNKVNNTDELKEDWFQRVNASTPVHPSERTDERWYYSEKMDGISLALYFRNGCLERAMTRGDGKVGEDIIANAVLMKGVKETLPENYSGGIRGEVVLPFEDYQKHFDGYANPRNAASGVARVEDREDARKCRHLSFYAYDFHLDEIEASSAFEKFEVLNNLGFKTPNNGGPISLDDIEGIYDEYENGFREELPYEIDGLVVQLNDLDQWERAGEHNNRPLGSIALKFAAETAVTTLQDVVWQVGETQRVTPVGIFDPVHLAGAEITNASLYNVAYIEELGLGIGDEVLVERANDVIPRVKRVTEDRTDDNTVEVPDACPECDHELEMDGEHLICPSDQCRARTTGRLKGWIEELDILGWGDKMINQLVQTGRVTDIPDLYDLEIDELAEMEHEGGKRVGEKDAKKVINRLHSKKEMALDQFLSGLRMELCRRKTFQKLMDDGLDSLEEIQKADVSRLKDVKGIGEERAEAIVNGMEENEEIIRDLLNHVSIKQKGGQLEGKTFCITGRLSEKRSTIKSQIKENGGRYKGSVTKDLDYLVTNNPNGSSNKLQKARKYDTEIISEDGLREMMS